MSKKTKNKISKLSKLIYFVLSLIFLILADTYFSDLIVENINSGYTFRNSILALNYVQNTGAAFNIFEGDVWLLVGIAAFAMVFLVSYVIRKIKTLPVIYIFWINFLIAGIFCNLYERVSLGYVRDFFEFTFVEFPIFNISDVFINIGIIAIVLLTVKKNIL